MSDIAALYEEVMAGAAETEKVASDVNDDTGPEFGPEFFEKVAAGDEASVTVLNDFIENAKAEGHSEEEIESAIVQVMDDAGIELGDDEGEEGDYVDDEASEFEQQKAAAFLEGAEKAIEDAMDSDFAKEAGVSMDDLAEFELGGQYGEGYAQTRSMVDNAILKIAEAKELEKEAGKIGDLASKLTGKLKSGYGKAKGGMASGYEKAKSGTSDYFAGGSAADIAKKRLGKNTVGTSMKARKAALVEAQAGKKTRGRRRKMVAGGAGVAALLAGGAAAGRGSAG